MRRLMDYWSVDGADGDRMCHQVVAAVPLGNGAEDI